VIILDASALLALLNFEPGAEIVRSALPDVAISIVNLAEVLTKGVERGAQVDRAMEQVRALGIPVEPFDEAQAMIAAELRRLTVRGGLSIGDRACLALATVKNAEVLTTDRVWKSLPHGVNVTLIR
jgi:PIN domain nuclease of toxin-antitoxin system